MATETRPVETVTCLECKDSQDTRSGTFATGILATRCENAGHTCRPVIGPAAPHRK